MKRTIRIITIAVLLIFPPDFNTTVLKAGPGFPQVPHIIIHKTGKILLLNGSTGFLKDDLTGVVYKFSYDVQVLTLHQGDRVIYTLDPTCGRVIVRAVTR